MSELSTLWTVVARAHAGGDPGREALAELLPRYCPAVYRYLRAIVRDPGDAEDLCQEFAYRFVRGDFKKAGPERGRFRDYLKASLQNLVADYHRRNAKAGHLVTFDSRVLKAVPASPEPGGADFVAEWRAELLNRAWATFRSECDGAPPTLHDVLRAKADHPELTSGQLAALLESGYAHLLTAANVRQMLRRARLRYGELLRAEVAAAIHPDDPTGVDDELADIGLLVYCPPGGPGA